MLFGFFQLTLHEIFTFITQMNWKKTIYTTLITVAVLLIINRPAITLDSAYHKYIELLEKG